MLSNKGFQNSELQLSTTLCVHTSMWVRTVLGVCGHVCVCVWNKTYPLCWYTLLFSIGPTKWDGSQFEKSSALERKIIRKHSFDWFSILTEDFPGWQHSGPNSKLAGHTSRETSAWIPGRVVWADGNVRASLGSKPMSLERYDLPVLNLAPNVANLESLQLR